MGPLLVVQLHTGNGDLAASADDVGGGDELVAAPRPQVVHPQVDGAEAGEALLEVAGGEILQLVDAGGGDYHAARHIQQTGGDAAVQNVVEGVADELLIHPDAQLHLVEVVVGHLHADQLVERHLLGEQVGNATERHLLEHLFHSLIPPCQQSRVKTPASLQHFLNSRNGRFIVDGGCFRMATPKESPWLRLPKPCLTPSQRHR